MPICRLCQCLFPGFLVGPGTIYTYILFCSKPLDKSRKKVRALGAIRKIPYIMKYFKEKYCVTVHTFRHIYTQPHAHTHIHMHIKIMLFLSTKYSQSPWNEFSAFLVFFRFLNFITSSKYMHKYTISLSLSIYIYINQIGLYIYIYIYVVSSISFQTFFVQAFKIVVDS